MGKYSRMFSLFLVISMLFTTSCKVANHVETSSEPKIGPVAFALVLIGGYFVVSGFFCALMFPLTGDGNWCKVVGAEAEGNVQLPEGAYGLKRRLTPEEAAEFMSKCQEQGCSLIETDLGYDVYFPPEYIGSQCKRYQVTAEVASAYSGNSNASGQERFGVGQGTRVYLAAPFRADEGKGRIFVKVGAGSTFAGRGIWLDPSDINCLE